jgi:hypothetical protein
MTAKELAYYLVGRAWQAYGEAPELAWNDEQRIVAQAQAHALVAHPVIGRDITIAAAYIHVHEAEVFQLITQGEV